MSISSRIHDTIEDWQAEWKDRLRGWALRTISEGVKHFLEADEPAAIANVDEMLVKIKANPNIPPELRAMITRIEGGGSWFMIVIVVIMAVQMAIQTISTLWTPTQKQISYVEERAAKTARFDPISAITAWRRDPVAHALIFEDLKDLGWSDERIETLKFITLYYPPPAELVNWQAKEVFEPNMIRKYGLDDELGEIQRDPFYKAGMTDEQITNFWRAHWQHPEFRTIVEMLRRTDFTQEDMRDWFRLVEIPPFWRQKLIDISYEVPTRVDVRRFWDMRTITEARLREIYEWQGYHGKDLEDYILWTKVYVAFPDLIARWKNGWISLSEVRAELTGYGMPAERVEELIQTKIKATQADRTAGERDVTKTDIIKGVKQGVITRGQGVDVLMDLGFDEDEAVYILEINIPQDQEDVVVKERQLTKTDIIKGLKTELITEAEARERLLGLRYSAVDVDLLIAIFKANIKPPAEPREREASKADIVLAVKKGLLEPEEAYLMLIDIGFTGEAAQFILSVRAETSPFSPINYAEFKDRSQKYRLAAGMEGKPMSEEIKKAAAEVVILTGEVKSLEDSIKAEESKLIPDEGVPPETTARLKQLQVKRNRAISTLELAKAEYDKRIAEWKHGPTE